MAAEHIRPERLAVVVVGDRATIQPDLEALELPIVRLDPDGRLAGD